MNIIIELYIFICIALLIFNIAFVLSKTMKGQKYYFKYSGFEKKLLKELEILDEEGKVTQILKECLTKDIKKTRNLIILQKQIKESNQSIIQPYIFDILSVYRKKTSYEQAYYTYVISKLDFSKEKVDGIFAEKFMDFLNSKSLYIFVNTINAVHQFGDVDLMILVIDKISSRSGYYHKKLFVDGLLTFQGDFEELSNKIVDNFHRYSNEVQENLIDFIRAKGININELGLKLLQNKNTDKQVKCAVMRYYEKFPVEETKAIFFDILNNEEATWVDKLLALRCLSKYNEELVKSVIKGKITDGNWHIRTAAAAYLYKQKIDRKEIIEIINLKDKYACEAIMYLYRNNDETRSFILNYIENQAKEQKQLENIKKNDAVLKSEVII